MNTLALFDIDNTLIQSSTGHRQTFVEAVKEVYGLEVDINVINYHGMTDQEIILKVLSKYNLDDEIIRSKLKACMAVMPEKYNEIVKSENIVILDGVVNILTKFQQNDIILGLVTGNLEEIARAKLKKIEVDRFFYFGGFGSDHMDRAYLARLAIRRAQEKSNLANFSKIFLFGDAPQDMKAAKAAGATAIGMTTGTFSKEQLLTAGADKVFASLEDTEKILKFILAS